ncbi:hypothetical protein J14TS2_11440 [Bacillus sp. J14TS2]|uniref:YesL family protein n=1 Tax=Bacillus sp. J14TS2 TaxID=2807188 RepID=UPI001B0677F8|nr:DUF624 domain-containing protein [Bacillus sp. J14TS2]GIN70669.1 hypothetical protein J14TS2_11440 [Bacillus sp. J14TS2]
MNPIMEKIHYICDWCMRLAYVNLLWILFTLIGLIILGIGPSTQAMFAVTRKWVMEGKEIPIFSTFWSSYRTEFIKSNMLFSILFVIGYVLFFDFRFLIHFEGWLYTVLTAGLASIMIIYLFTALFTYPMFAHYNIKIAQYLRYSFLIVISHPLQLLLLTIIIVPIVFIFLIFPGLLLFFSGSVISLVITHFAWSIFKKLDSNHALAGD